MSNRSSIIQHWRQSETWLLFISITLAIFASYSLTSIGVLMQRSLVKTSAELMGADRIMSATRPAQDEWIDYAIDHRLSVTKQRLFNSVVYAGEALDAPMQLVSIKAVDQYYPAKGELVVETSDGTHSALPKPGSVYLGKRLKDLLEVELGQQIEIGNSKLLIAGWLTREPDSGLSMFGNLPSILMMQEDVAETGIVQPGSRITYRYLFVGENEDLAHYDEWVKEKLTEIYRYQGVGGGNFALSAPLQRSDTFLRLAALLTVLLTLAAMAVISNRLQADKVEKLLCLRR